MNNIMKLVGKTFIVKVSRYLIPIIVLVQLFGCATTQHESLPVDNKAMPALHQDLSHKGWWRIQFVKHWPEEEPAPFSYDLLLADRVIQPVLKRNREKISLWRFHRRAARDDAGSKFSFIFYSGIEDARTIAAEISNHDMVELLVDHQVIDKIWGDEMEDIIRPDISDASDGVWPEEIQRSWPYFIMGVSQSWLALINELTRKYPFPGDADSIEELLTYYNEVSNRVDFYWANDGGHAYIHHLSALFAYRPVGIKF
jgi:hypothetical protein